MSRQSGVPSGVMYPILQRMLDEGWLAEGWEDHEQHRAAKRPPRRYLEPTGRGRAALDAMVAEARSDPRFGPLLAPGPGVVSGA